MPPVEAQKLGILEAEGLIHERTFAAEFNKSLRTVRRWDELGIGPVKVKLGKENYYRRSAISKWIADQEKKRKR
jgi:hypothetical protein